ASWSAAASAPSSPISRRRCQRCAAKPAPTSSPTMLDDLRETRLRAARVGPIAAQALSNGGTGRVHSVVEHSAYLSIRNQLVCLGPSALGNGPLNLLCETWPYGGARRAALQVRDPVRADRDLLHVGRALTVSLAGAEGWHPTPIGEWDRHRLSVGLAA